MTRPRYGRRHFGVAPGGAFDRESFELANALVGNFDGEPCLELSGCSLSVRASEDCAVGWVGAGASQRVELLASGSVRRFGSPLSGCRSYLVVSSGFCRLPSGELGSFGCSMGLNRLPHPPSSLGDGPFRVLEGPQAGLLDLPSFLSSGFVVANEMDRTGLRLRCSSPGALAHRLELPSEPSVMGAIQLLPSGDAIILGPDGPTIGGYPKIAVVAGIDLDRVAQLRPEDNVRFEQVSLEEARTMLFERQAAFERTLAEIKIALASKPSPR